MQFNIPRDIGTCGKLILVRFWNCGGISTRSEHYG